MGLIKDIKDIEPIEFDPFQNVLKIFSYQNLFQTCTVLKHCPQLNPQILKNNSVVITTKKI